MTPCDGTNSPSVAAGVKTARGENCAGGPHRLYILDGLRFAACCWVLVWHYQHFFMTAPGVLPDGWCRASQPLYSLLKWFYENNHGVQVFWALSGFVFFHVYWDAVSRRFVGAKKFFVNRLSRLYPLIFVTTLAVYCLQKVDVALFGQPFIYPNNTSVDLLRNLLCVPYIVPNGGWSLNAPFWSVSIELVFYALFFVMARFCRCSGFVAALVAFLVFSHEPVPKMVVGYEMLNSCGYFFFLGGIVQSVSSKAIQFAVNRIKCSVVRRCRVGEFLQMLGDLSFGMYLWHVPVQIAMIAAGRLGFVPFCPEKPQYMLVFVVCVIFLSYISFRFFEFPMRKLIRSRLP